MSQSALDSLYKEIILEHGKDPRNFGSLEKADVVREGFNPLCGDRISLSLKFDTDRIKECKFSGTGCSICMASSSIMTEEVQGETVEQAKGAILKFRELMLGTRSPEEFKGDLEALAGVRKFPVRIKCALLGWTTLQDALKEMETKTAQKTENQTGNNDVSTTE